MKSVTTDIWSEEDHAEILEFVEKKLWLFVQENANIHRPEQVICNLAQLSYEDFRYLSVIYFLLSAPVQNFVKQSTPNILRNLPQSSSQVITEVNGGIRGNVDWNRTVKRRFGLGGGDPTIFITRRSMKSYELPEVQSLKYLLVHVNHFCSEVLGNVSTEERSSTDRIENWKDDIRELSRLTNFYLQNICLREVKLPSTISDLTLQRVRCSRNSYFRSLHESLDLYRKLFVQNSRKALQDCLAKGILKPLSKDTLYELYILLLTMASLTKRGWSQEHLRLIGYGKGVLARYKHGDSILRLYYQTLPRVFADNSFYGDFTRKYGISSALRRPDITIELAREKSDYKILEVKRTQDKDYILDSIYKVLGYLKDFAACFDDSVFPHGMLVVWEWVGENEPVNDELVLLGRKTYQQFLEKNVLGIHALK